MAFRRKALPVMAYRPDIIVVQECEHPDKIKFGEELPQPSGILWFGDNRHKGLGVFSFGDYKLKLRRTHNPAFKMIVPIAVSGGTLDFDLYAVWANNPDDPDGQYVEQVWKAIQHYDKKLGRKLNILAGDFNSNTIWDRKYREGNHSNVVKRLAKKKIVSCYHEQYKQEQGKEQHPTFYLYRHRDKPYHLDYCFVSEALAKKVVSVEVGEYDHWMKYSDHVPLVVEFED